MAPEAPTKEVKMVKLTNCNLTCPRSEANSPRLECFRIISERNKESEAEKYISESLNRLFKTLDEILSELKTLEASNVMLDKKLVIKEYNACRPRVDFAHNIKNITHEPRYGCSKGEEFYENDLNCQGHRISHFTKMADHETEEGKLLQESKLVERLNQFIKKIKMASDGKRKIVRSRRIGECLEEVAKKMHQCLNEVFQKRKEINRSIQDKIDKIHKNEVGKLLFLIKEKSDNELFLNNTLEKLEELLLDSERGIDSFIEVETLQNVDLYEIISNRDNELQLLGIEIKNLQISIKEKTYIESFLKSRLEKLEEELLSEVQRGIGSFLEVETLELKNDGLYEIISKRDKEIERLMQVSNELKKQLQMKLSEVTSLVHRQEYRQVRPTLKEQLHKEELHAGDDVTNYMRSLF